MRNLDIDVGLLPRFRLKLLPYHFAIDGCGVFAHPSLELVVRWSRLCVAHSELFALILLNYVLMQIAYTVVIHTLLVLYAFYAVGVDRCVAGISSTASRPLSIPRPRQRAIIPYAAYPAPTSFQLWHIFDLTMKDYEASLSPRGSLRCKIDRAAKAIGI